MAVSMPHCVAHAWQRTEEISDVVTGRTKSESVIHYPWFTIFQVYYKEQSQEKIEESEESECIMEGSIP